MEVGSYIALNGVLVLARPKEGTREMREWSVMIQSGRTKRIVRASPRSDFRVGRFVVKGPSGRGLALQLLVVPDPSDHSYRHRTRVRSRRHEEHLVRWSFACPFVHHQHPLASSCDQRSRQTR